MDTAHVLAQQTADQKQPVGHILVNYDKEPPGVGLDGSGILCY